MNNTVVRMPKSDGVIQKGFINSDTLTVTANHWADSQRMEHGTVYVLIKDKDYTVDVSLQSASGMNAQIVPYRFAGFYHALPPGLLTDGLEKFEKDHATLMEGCGLILEVLPFGADFRQLFVDKLKDKIEDYLGHVLVEYPEQHNLHAYQQARVTVMGFDPEKRQSVMEKLKEYIEAYAAIPMLRSAAEAANAAFSATSALPAPANI